MKFPFPLPFDPFDVGKEFLDSTNGKKIVDLVRNKFNNPGEAVSFAQKILKNNSLKELINGRLRISEETVNEFVSKLITDSHLDNHKEIQSIDLSLQEGHIDGTADVLVKNDACQVTFQVNEVRFNLSEEIKEVCFVLDSTPSVKMEKPLKKIFFGLADSLMRSLHGEGKLFKGFLKDFDGVSMSGNEITVDLRKVPSLKEVVESEVFGVNILDFVRIDKVELLNGEMLLHGGLKVPN